MDILQQVRVSLLVALVAVGCDREAKAPQRSQSSVVVAQTHDHFTGSVPADSGLALCGIPTDLEFAVTDSFAILADGHFTDTGTRILTYTNPRNGKAVVISLSGQIGGRTIVDSVARTITFVTSYEGLPEKIRTAKGSVLTRDAGGISFTDTFNLDTGDFVSARVVSNGPHPDAYGDFNLFCQVVAPALS